MDITEVFYPHTRQHWHNWLAEHHLIKKEVWVQKFLKASGKPCISYDDLVEECLCFGWIDGTQKKYDEESSVQRITPRRKKSFLSELNRQRIWKLQHLGLMTPAGIAPIESQIGSPDDPFQIPQWILESLQQDEQVWRNFEEFPHFYKRLKVNWITEAGQLRMEEMQKRLNHLLKMTAQGKRYGSEPMIGLVLEV
ncbi:MAG: YdeI/OmpD-associated family protein [Saprospiraceae bacterium]|nr:YdeI/OmpD-associated family protein [Saprospiraceae bacterium]